MAENTESGGKIELARAYVQIVPSFDGLQSELRKGLGKPLEEYAEESGESSGSKFSEAFLNVSTKILKATVAAGLAETVASFVEGGKLEQSLGGVETLFKDSAEKVEEYAQEAFATAGISANDYMEQATAFAAGLISSLEGDTSAAADVADMAMQDMADNANKYGTGIESIQNAYQGFMRKTYVMLDNLKIGYGGTKAEMERLLEDAEEISGVEYNIDNLSDVFNAIHVIQTELGITGTTAEEAKTTFQGSFSQMKAAAQNLLGYMSSGFGDVGQATNDLLDSTGTFFGNAWDMAENFTSALGDIGDAIDERIADKLGVAQGAVEAFRIAFTTALTVISAKLLEVALAKKIGDITFSVTSLSDGISNLGASVKNLLTPANIAVAGITEVALLLKNAFDDATEAIDVTGDSLTELYMSDEEKQLIEDVESLADEYSSLHEQVTTSISDLDTQAATADELIDKLYDLDNQTDKTSDEQEEMETIIDTLNGTYDDLGLELDDTTGKLNKTEGAVRDLVEEQLKQAKANALSEELADLYEQQYKAEKKVAEAQENYNKELEEWRKLEDTYESYMYYLDAIQNGVALSDEQLEEWNELYNLVNNTYGGISNLYNMRTSSGEAEAYTTLTDMKGVLDGINDDIESVTDYMNEDYDSACDTVVTSSERAEQALQKLADNGTAYTEEGFAELVGSIKDEYASYTEEIADTMDSVWDSFDLFSSKSLYDSEGNLTTTKSDLQEALDSNLEYIQGWLDDMNELAERGISGRLMETLQEAGINSAAEVHAMTTMTDPELQEYCAKFDEAYSYVDDVAEYELGQVTQASAETIAALIEDATGKKADVEEVYRALAEGTVDSYVEGLEASIEEDKEQAVAAANTLGTNVGDGFKWGLSSVAETMGTTYEDLYGEEFSTSMYNGMYIAGQDAGQGFADGIESKKSFVSTVSAAVGKLAQKALRMTLDINSPSKEMRKIGAYASEGFALGINDNADTVGNTATMIGQEAMNGVRSEFNSPQIAFSTRAAVDTAVNANVNLTDRDSQKQATFNLILDGNKIAQVTAPYLDVLNGANLSFAGRSLAV